MTLAFITGLAGARLEPAEKRFLRDSVPAGLIVFARNIETREQLRRLIGEARDAIGENETLVLVDQEGGRVQRMGPPEWSPMPEARALGRRYERAPDEALEMARALAGLIARDLVEVGINTDCVPVLDVPVAGAHDIIGSRAFSQETEIVTALGRAFADGLMAQGVVAVGKHVPGHGRARADSHLELPVVDAERDELAASDFLPFKALSDLPAMMTAHVVYSAIDGGAAASISRTVHDEIIRGAIGFDGLLMSDDLSMAALEGPLSRRAEQVIAAGSDLALYCKGVLSEMEEVARSAPRLEGKGRDRLSACAAIAMGRADSEFAQDVADEIRRDLLAG